mmetsp:Transcript_111280/g.265501  ORF Transcript_111280/g.265501 Transcript_111280/m.265501 type:complete len:318 (-) Transcript_111280:1656-2609(-)
MLGRVGVERLHHLTVRDALLLEKLALHDEDTSLPGLVGLLLRAELPELLVEVHIATVTANLAILCQEAHQLLAIGVADTHVLHSLLEDVLRHVTATLLRNLPAISGRVDLAVLGGRLGDDLVRAVRVDHLPDLLAGVVKQLVTSCPLGEDRHALVSPRAPVAAFSRTEIVDEIAPRPLLLATVQILAVGDETLHVLLQAHLPVDLDLLVDADIVLVANDWHICPNFSIRHAGPAGEGSPANARGLVSEVWPEVEGCPTPQRHGRVQGLTFGYQFRPESWRLLVVPLPIRGHPDHARIDVDSQSHDHISFQLLWVVCC